MLYLLMQVFAYHHLCFDQSQASSPTFEEAVGDRCMNNTSFSITFVTNAGDACTKSKLCEGSHLRSMFKSKVERTCVERLSLDDTHDNLQVVTTFQSS